MSRVIRDRKQRWVERFEAVMRLFFRFVSRDIDRKLTDRAASRGSEDFQWLTRNEALTAEQLANLLVPSDDDTPGMEEICVLGPSALESLDRLIARSPERRELYGRGLLAFDLWAQLEQRCAFASLPHQHQLRLLRSAELILQEWQSPGPVVRKAWRRLKILARAKGVPFSAAQLFPRLRDDCLQIFYTSRVSWIWLEYDGPPMDRGYPELVEHSEGITTCDCSQ